MHRTRVVHIDQIQYLDRWERFVFVGYTKMFRQQALACKIKLHLLIPPRNFMGVIERGF